MLHSGLRQVKQSMRKLCRRPIISPRSRSRTRMDIIKNISRSLRRPLPTEVGDLSFAEVRLYPMEEGHPRRAWLWFNSRVWSSCKYCIIRPSIGTQSRLATSTPLSVYSVSRVSHRKQRWLNPFKTIVTTGARHYWTRFGCVPVCFVPDEGQRRISIDGTTLVTVVGLAS